MPTDRFEWGGELLTDFLNDAKRVVTLTWDAHNSSEADAARKTFSSYSEKGWIAFTEGRDGRRIQLHSFDPLVRKIILVQLAEGG